MGYFKSLLDAQCDHAYRQGKYDGEGQGSRIEADSDYVVARLEAALDVTQPQDDSDADAARLWSDYQLIASSYADGYNENVPAEDVDSE